MLITLSNKPMNRFLIAFGLAALALHAETAPAPAPPVSIQPAVQVTFETRTNLYYQLETVSELSPNSWNTIGPPLRGNGQPLNQTVLTSPAVKQFFRTQEYDLTNGLFAYYPFNGDRADATKTSGSIPTSLPLTTNRFGATNSAVQLWQLWYPATATATLNASAAGTNDLTISFWFTNPGTNAPQQLLFFRGSREFQITQAEPKSNALQLLNTNYVVSFVTKPVQWTTNRWYHLQLICKENTFKLYRDLDLLGQGPATPPIGLHPNPSVSTGPPFGGADEIRLHNRALTDDERSILYRLEE